MRDLGAALVALALILVALSLLTTLHAYRKRRARMRDSERALGRTIIAELPADEDLVLFSEDDVRFYYGSQSIDKDVIHSARLLVNGAAIASVLSQRHTPRASGSVMSQVIEDRIEGIARDRWDVAIDTEKGMTLVECGAIRERVSQELARAIFGSVKTAIERTERGTR